MIREGSLEAPTRHPIDWSDPEFTDPEKIDAELRRVFDICHTCRRCFNLCDSFARLFDLIDESKSGELDSVDFRHLMLRARAAEHARGETGFALRQLTETDRNGNLARLTPGLANGPAASRTR